MKQLTYYIALFLFVALPFDKAVADNSIGDKLTLLDKCLKDKDEYDKTKEQKISECRARLAKARTATQQYDACIKLYEEYKSYQYDSAYHYANLSHQLAKNINNKNFYAESECAMAFCLLSAGLYKEAFDRLESVDVSDIEPKYKKAFYSLAARLNYDIADYNHSEPYHSAYIRKGHEYTDSLLTLIAPPNSPDALYAIGQRYMKEQKYDDSRKAFTDLMKHKDINIHTLAIVTSCLGWTYWRDKEFDKAMSYLAESAMYDIKSSTKETTALRNLAELLYQNGDIQRATRYIQLSLDDAKFYGARQRKIEVGEILPIIEANRYELLQTKNHALTAAVTVISLLVIAILIALSYLYRQKKNLQEARKVIDKKNEAMEHAYHQLQEANNIKNEYIGNSFYINSEFIDKMENLYNMIDRKIQTRQYDDLRYSLKKSVLNKERDNMYNAFDTTFLKIFPNFVEQYNSLFPENERKTPEKEMTLTTEMRIFALIRLGINESERIAKFLNYSVHTVNTYKTRVKNKSLVDNSTFEKRIQQIGGSN